jgi:hypothetical protein
MMKTELLEKLSHALALFNGGPAVEHQADAAFEKLLCPAFAPGEFTEEEWRGIYAENDRLWALLKDDKSRKRNAYAIGLLQYAFKAVEARS